jgi:hypothetical protein
MSQPLAVLLAAVVLVLFLTGAILGIVLFDGSPEQKQLAITAILTASGPLLGVLVLIVRQQFTLNKVDAVTTLVNGHLGLHTDPATPTGVPPASPTL